MKNLNNTHACKDVIQPEYEQRKESLAYKDKVNNSFMTSVGLRDDLNNRADKLDISKNDLMTIYCERGLSKLKRKGTNQTMLNEKLVHLAIKTMQLHKYDPKEIKEAISLHSEIKLSLI